jgi:hypothetical protein
LDLQTFAKSEQNSERRKPMVWKAPRTRRAQHPADDATMGCASESKMGLFVRAVYERERSRYETLREGRLVRYKAPLYYNRRAALRASGDDGSGDPIEPARDSTWEAMATFFLQARIDPELYIRIQFEPASLRLHDPPEPRQLLTPARQTLYTQAKAALAGNIALSLGTQQEIATSEAAYVCSSGRSTADAVAHVIADENLELSPLFRYCLARSMTGERFQTLAGIYKVRAVLQYVCYADAYQATWHQHLPVGFARMAESLYEIYLSQAFS